MKCRYIAALVVVATLSACASFPGKQIAEAEGQSTKPSYSVTYQEKPTAFYHLAGPSTGVQGQPITIEAWVGAGTDGCDLAGNTRVVQNGKQVVLAATYQDAIVIGAMCGQMVPEPVKVTIQFTPTEVGVHQVEVERFAAGSLHWTIKQSVGDVTPAATLDIEVVAPE